MRTFHSHCKRFVIDVKGKQAHFYPWMSVDPVIAAQIVKLQTIVSPKVNHQRSCCNFGRIDSLFFQYYSRNSQMNHSHLRCRHERSIRERMKFWCLNSAWWRSKHEIQVFTYNSALLFFSFVSVSRTA